jgi:hypothetical protein
MKLLDFLVEKVYIFRSLKRRVKIWKKEKESRKIKQKLLPSPP